MSDSENIVKVQAENLNLKSQVDKLASIIEEKEAKIKEHDKELAVAKKEVATAQKKAAEAEDVLKNNQKEGETNKRNIAELLSLRRQVQDAKKKEDKLQAEIDDLNEQLDAAMNMTPQGSISFKAGGGGGISDEELKKRLEECKEEVQAKAEEEMFAITVELEEQIDSQKAEIQELKEKLHNTSVQSASGANDAVVERAMAEKAIALRVKDGAVAECGQVRAELEKTGVVMADLKSQVKVLEVQLEEARSNPGTTPAKHRDATLGLDSDLDNSSFAESPAGKVMKAQLGEKEKLVKYLQDRVSDIEMKNKQLEMEKEGDAQNSSNDAKLLQQKVEDLSLQLELVETTHAGELERLIVDMGIVTAERDKAMAAGKRAFLERNQAISDAKAAEQKREQLARLQKRASADAATVETVMGKTDSTFDQMLAKIEAAGDDDTEKRDAMYDTIFEKEHQLWNLKNDLESMSTIRKMREEELVNQANAQWSGKCEEYMSAIEILRMQIKELGKDPMC